MGSCFFLNIYVPKGVEIASAVKTIPINHLASHNITRSYISSSDGRNCGYCGHDSIFTVGIGNVITLK